MRASTRIIRVIVLLVGLGVLLIAAPTVAGRFIGNRIYLLNSTSCPLALMSEHEGLVAQPGQTVLAKNGLIDRTPTMMIAVNNDIWFGGLHFSSKKLEIRDHEDVLVPASWVRVVLGGTTLTYEVTDAGLQLETERQSPKAQPLGLPLSRRSGSQRSIACVRG